MSVGPKSKEIKKKTNSRLAPRAPRIADLTDTSTPNPTQEAQGPSTDGADTVFVCATCQRSFTTKTGLGVHVRRAHVEVANAGVSVERIKERWSEEERRIMAAVEVRGMLSGARFMNQYIVEHLQTSRTLESIKGTRRNPKYKKLVSTLLEEARTGTREDSPDSDENICATPSPGPSRGRVRSAEHISIESTEPFEHRIRELIKDLEGVTDFKAELLVSIAEQQLGGEDVAESLTRWLSGVFDSAGQQQQAKPRRWRRKRAPVNSRRTKWRERRREYAEMQTLFQRNPGLAASRVLDGRNESRSPDLSEMTEFWEPILRERSAEHRAIGPASEKSELRSVWGPIEREELLFSAPPLNTAAGPDGITARQWRSVSPPVIALLYNIILRRGSFPASMLESRTIFLPKKRQSVNPADFRPISIASVVVRQLHKILTMRLRRANLVDERQRCMEDGCAENITVLASLLDDARHSLRELHVVSLDCAKAFDSISHHAIDATLREYGLPAGFVQYIARTYSNSSTRLEVGRRRSEPIKVNRGVRQGDPLSTLIFCLCFDRVTRALLPHIGYDFHSTRINALLYADDAFLVATTAPGMDILLRSAEESAGEMGLTFNTSKCTALSLVPSGKEKKLKVITTPTFRTSQGFITQVTPSQEWRYLGVDFQYSGPKRASRSLKTELECISRAPLKPQQRLLVLRAYLMPRYYHHLVLSRTTLGHLRGLDLQVRSAVRRWLSLPRDIPTAYFHTTTKEGGLGLPAFETSIPCHMYCRLKSMESSTCEAARAAALGYWVQKRIHWSTAALTKNGEALRCREDVERWWADRLHRSVDGRELRECSGESSSSAWVNSAMNITGRDYVQYHHIRINSIPTRIRTSRGVRRADMDVMCRAGCRVTETTAHVIQGCHRTHGGRILRHNAVCKVLASGLRDKGWVVREEPILRTQQGLRKPDIVAVKEGVARVIDAQIVSGSRPLDEAHEIKRKYYSDNRDITVAIAQENDILPSSVGYTSCTLSWRGVWSPRSAADLLRVGLSKKLLGFITLRVLRGSHLNWTRWGKMTTMRPNQDRVGIG